LKNYYAILEVPVGCSLEEIRQAYRRLAQEHLDDADAFAELKEAHETLSTPSRRAEYDLEAYGKNFAPSLPGNPEEPQTQDTQAVPQRTGYCPMGLEDNCPVLQGRLSPDDAYCPECGARQEVAAQAAPDKNEAGSAPMTRLEEADGTVHPLHIGSNLAGREAGDILLPDKTVSRQHARLEIIPGGSDDGTDAILLEDLNSTNGTQVNDQPLVPHVPRRLAHGDSLRFGSVLTTLYLPVPPPALNRAEAPLSQGITPGEAHVPVDPGGRTVRAHLQEMREAGPGEVPPRLYSLIQGITTFGRRPENTIVLQGDPYVSGLHAQIVGDGDRFLLTDMGSTNGTLLNGDRLPLHEPFPLSEGDVVVIGGTALRFEPISSEETEGDTSLPDDTNAPGSEPAMPTEG